MRKSDVMSALCWFVLGAVVMVSAYELRLGTFNNPGAGLVPFLLGALLAGAAVPVLTGGVHHDGSEPADPAWVPSDLRNPAIIATCVVAYGLILEVAGFMAATFLFLLALLKLLEPRPWRRALAIAAIAAVVAQAVFVVLLEVELPAGMARQLVEGR